MLGEPDGQFYFGMLSRYLRLFIPEFKTHHLYGIVFVVELVSLVWSPLSICGFPQNLAILRAFQGLQCSLSLTRPASCVILFGVLCGIQSSLHWPHRFHDCHSCILHGYKTMLHIPLPIYRMDDTKFCCQCEI